MHWQKKIVEITCNPMHCQDPIYAFLHLINQQVNSRIRDSFAHVDSVIRFEIFPINTALFLHLQLRRDH